MICPKCNTENSSDAKFCRNCGQPLERRNEDDSEDGCLWYIVGLVELALAGVIIYLVEWVL